MIKKMNVYLLHVIYSQKKENMTETLIQFYDMLEKIFHHDKAEVYAYLHRNMNHSLAMEVNDAKFPGLMQKTIDSIEDCFRYKFITKMQDKLKTEWTTLDKILSASYSLGKIIAHQVDLVKDATLTISLLYIMGGVVALYNFPTKFSSAIVMSFAGTIIIPWTLSSLQLAISDPYLIFLFMRQRAAKLSRAVMVTICFLLSFLNEFLLEFNFEEAEEIAILSAKKFKEYEVDEILRLFDDCKSVKKQVVENLKTNLGIILVFRTKYCNSSSCIYRVIQ